MRSIGKESIKGKILRSVIMGIGIGVTMSNKRAMYKLTKKFIKDILNSDEEEKVKRELYLLRRQKLIDVKKEGNSHKIVLTEQGQKICLRFNYENLEIKKPKIWDMKLRMVLFDIPDTKKRARDALVFKLKEIGFIKFNNSVWVYPYPCQKEIDFVANYWGIGRYIHFALISNITNEDILLKHFKLS